MPKKIYYCGGCNRKFYDKEELNQFWDALHDRDIYLCKDCSLSIDDARSSEEDDSHSSEEDNSESYESD